MKDNKLEDIIERNTDTDGTIISIKDIITEVESEYVHKTEIKKAIKACRGGGNGKRLLNQLTL